MSQRTERDRKRLILWQSFVTAYLTLTAGGGLGGILNPKLSAFLALLGAAMNAGTTTYVAGMRGDDTPSDRPRLIVPGALP